MGHYLFDDQGVPSERVTLVEDGILKGFLMSRTPVENFSHSNGHGRNNDYEYPMARMGNFIADTSQGKSRNALKEILISESVKKEKPYGIIIKDVEGGETNTSRYSFQAFKCTPKMVYRVDLDSGKEILVRGIEFVGTPLTSISKIIAAGNACEVHNGFCGAESGFIPVSTVAPSLLVEELELQRTMGKNRKPPLLPFPQ
jgi:predicted Zn-dependent protease